MDLLNILDKKLSNPTRKPKKPMKRTPEQSKRYNIRYCINLIKRGDLDLTRRSHYMLYNLAFKEGYINKNLDILREVP